MKAKLSIDNFKIDQQRASEDPSMEKVDLVRVRVRVGVGTLQRLGG